MQVLANDLGRVSNTSEAVNTQLSSAYTSLVIMIAINAAAMIMCAGLACAAITRRSRGLMLMAAFVLAAAGVVFWSTDAFVYGLWISAKDVCGAAAVYVDSTLGERLASQISLELVPCLHYLAAGDLADSGKQAYTDLMQRANSLLRGAYPHVTHAPASRWRACACKA